MPIINCIKANFARATIRNCSEQNCKLRLDGLSNFIILKGERICKNRKICDCIIFIIKNCIIIGIVELKSKTVHAREILKKLHNGSVTALRILKKCSNKEIKKEFYHLVLCKGWSSSSEYIKLTKEKIIIEGKRYNIIPKRCGISFSALISTLK